jgi:hypothetical protein
MAVADPALLAQRRVTGHYARFEPKKAWLQATPVISVEHRSGEHQPTPGVGIARGVPPVLIERPWGRGVEGKLDSRRRDRVGWIGNRFPESATGPMDVEDGPGAALTSDVASLTVRDALPR